jgi:hypothetical protein
MQEGEFGGRMVEVHFDEQAMKQSSLIAMN